MSNLNRSHLVTTREAAQRLGLATGTLCNLRSRGGGPAFVRLGRAIRYAVEDLEEFVSRNRHRATA